MNQTQKHISLILTLAMIFALSACSSTGAVLTTKVGREFLVAEQPEAGTEEAPLETDRSAETTAVPDADKTGAEDTSSASAAGEQKTTSGKTFGKPAQNGAQSGQSPAQSGSQPSQPPNNGGTQNGNTGNGGSGSNQGGGSSSGGIKPHEHYWNPVYGTKHHKEEGHYENVEVKAAWDEPQYEYWEVCNTCGAKIHGALAAVDHISDDHDGAGTYSTKQFVSGYIHHDAVYEKQWVH